MKLKRVKIVGFKTFADKTEFSLDGNIVAVVGPNGCGKSNIVDSVLWGLGETSTKAVRAQSGKEVIFAGSVHRKPLGFAEVTLQFDNEDGALPIDTPEVSITRRIDRSGQGSYEINRRSCRLKDVADLLSDSGLGRAGYAIVGQSDIDQALAASPQQRRAWIDEAAGVQRYRIRRQESMRRLDSARQNLQRVHDIVQEIENQREPLAQEAETAFRYKSALNSLRSVESGLLVRELSDAVTEMTALDENIQSAQKLFVKESDLAVQCEKAAKTASELHEKIGLELENLRDSREQVKSKRDQAESQYQIALHRLQSLQELEQNLSAEATDSRDRVVQAEQDLHEAEAQFFAEKNAYSQLQEDLAGAGTETANLKLKLAESESKLAKARQSIAELHRAELERAHREQRLQDIYIELDGVMKALPELEQGIFEAEQALGQLESASTLQYSEIRTLEQELGKAKSQEEQYSSEIRKALAELAVQDGKRRGIESTLDALEGLSQGSRAVLQLVKSGELKSQYVPVGESVTVRSDLALAIDIALGATANDLIVPSEEEAKAAIAILKNRGLGRATFQPLTLVRQSSVSEDLKRISHQPGIVGIASELIECSKNHRPVITSLLGRVLIVETLDYALKLPRSASWSRCVSLDGDILHSSGAVTGGRAIRQTSGLVQRQSELAEAKKYCQKLQKEIASLEKQVEKTSLQGANLADEVKKKKAEQEPMLLEIESARSWLASLRQEFSASERVRTKLELEQNALEQVTLGEAIEVDIEQIERERDEIWKQLSAKNSDVESSTERLKEGAARLESADRRKKECSRRLEALQEAEAKRGIRANNLEPERIKSEQVKLLSHEEQQKLEIELDKLSESLMAVGTKKREAQDEERLMTERAQEARKSAQQAELLCHQSEIKRTRFESKKSAALERLLTEYGINESMAIETAPTTKVPDDAGTLVQRLRRELKEMGDVNLGAIEAYERLTERYEELTGQSDDIQLGIDEIVASISELDRITNDKFSKTFAEVKAAFRETFQRVFGGGEGVLELVQSESDLDAGVAINVTIPGKKKQRLELLSGGERALSGLAFLFSLLKVKPSPLVILDEIDAPLDGRNVERFIGLMRDFSDQIQFILVTHNPMTIESADIWFGVTMQEPGVSTLVPFKVPENSVVKAVIPDAYLKG